MMYLAAIALTSSLQPTPAKPLPKEPEEPLAVYVFTEVPGDPNDGNSVGRTTEEVAKRVRDRKKWFRLVPSREEADIAVEVLDQSSDSSASQNFVTRTDNSTESTDPQMTAFADVRDTFALLTRVHVPKGDPVDMKVESGGRRPRDAAKPFALRLEMFCRQNYWTLMEALER